MSKLDTNFIPNGAQGTVLFVRWPLSSITQVRTANRHAQGTDTFGDHWETGKTYLFSDYEEDVDFGRSCFIEDEKGKSHLIDLDEGLFIIQSWEF